VELPGRFELDIRKACGTSHPKWLLGATWVWNGPVSTQQLKVDDVVHGASRNSRQLIHHETVIDIANQPHVSAKKVLEYPSSIAQLFVSEIVARMVSPIGSGSGGVYFSGVSAIPNDMRIVWSGSVEASDDVCVNGFWVYMDVAMCVENVRAI
jgi:hypothetical protein